MANERSDEELTVHFNRAFLEHADPKDASDAGTRAVYDLGQADALAPLRAILEPLRELEKRATPGEWRHWARSDVPWDDAMSCGYDSREHHRGPPYYCTGPRVSSADQASADAEFIVAARNAVSALLALLPTPPASARGGGGRVEP